MSASELEKAKETAFKFLSYQPRSIYEVRQKLFQKSYDSVITEQVIERLKELKFLDDDEFAGKMARDLVNAKGCGIYYIADKLKKKGIHSETIIKVTDHLFSQIDEKEIAKELVLKKKRSLLNDPADKGRLGRYLQSRGYGWETIQVVIQELNDRERDKR